jgi:hypothetical protein
MDCSTLTYILGIGIGPLREGWAYATGTAFRAVTGRGIFAYAVTAALTPKDRREWERDLLARNLELFSERTGTRPDFDESFLHYRQQIVDVDDYLVSLATIAEYAVGRDHADHDRADRDGHGRPGFDR